MRYRLRTLIFILTAAPVLLAVPFVEFFTLPLRNSDGVTATRELVAFAVEDSPLPGFGDPQFDRGMMRKMHQIFVICDYLPPEVVVSPDPRVKRITQADRHRIYNKHGFNGTSYLYIELKAKSPSALTFEVSNGYGPVGGYSYRFEFRRKWWGLCARGEFGWVS